MPAQIPGNRVDDTSTSLAHWLQEVARGPAAAPAPAEPNDVVLAHLEQVTGHKLRSRAAIDALLTDLVRVQRRVKRRGMRRGIVRGALLLVLLLASALHYYYWSVSLEIVSMPSVQVFGVARPQPPGPPAR